MKPLSKKTYASIFCAKDDFKAIREMGQDLKVTNSYKTAKAMLELANKWLADFEDVNPSWKPDEAPATATITEKA